MKNKKFSYLILLLILTTSLFARANPKITDFETGITLSMLPYGSIGGVFMIDTAITIENGNMWIWGFRGSGQQGNGQTGVAAYTAPQRVQKFVDEKINITQSAGGAYHILALDEQGSVWGWGQNGYKEAGAGVCGVAYVNIPCRILKFANIVQIGAGEYHSLALNKHGNVYTWGRGIYGETGNGTQSVSNSLHKIPQEYFGNQPVVLIGAAYEGGYAVNASGQVFGWGDDQHNSFGYENLNEHEYRARPVPLNIQVGESKIDYICGGEGFTEYLLDNGEVWGMGLNSQLGIGKGSGKTAKPVKIMEKVKTLYCRYSSSIAITFNNEIYTWGIEGYEMGGKSPIMRNNDKNITKVDGGKHHIIYWTDTGDIYGVGYSASFKFGRDGTVSWPGIKMTDFVVKEMKKTYGENYIPGQGQ